MRLPERQDFLDYAEGSCSDALLQKRILQMLASSPVMREQLAEIKRDLYMVSSQVPDYAPGAPFGAELSRLAQTWLQLAYNRKFAMRNFYRTREFFWLLVALAGGTLLVLALVGAHLMG